VSLVWLDGDLVPRKEASVSVDDLGLLYGAACFETMRAFNGTVFRFERHLDRLESGLRLLGVAPPPRAALREALRDVLAANELRDARIRLTVTAGRGHGRPDLASGQSPAVLLVAEPAPADPPPATLAVVSARLDAARPYAAAKHANYLTSLLALAEARAAGGDEALLLNHAGHVAEGATSNVFAVLDGTLLTPARSDGPLPGVTREVILECAAALRLASEERSVALETLAQADELFLTNSIVGVRPAAAILDSWSSATVPGPVTELLAREYAKLVREECGLPQ